MGARVCFYLDFFFFCMKGKNIYKNGIKCCLLKKDSWYIFFIFKNHRYRKFHSGLSNIVLNSSLVVVVVGKQELCVFFLSQQNPRPSPLLMWGKIKINEIWDRSNTKNKIIVHFSPKRTRSFFFFQLLKSKNH